MNKDETMIYFGGIGGGCYNLKEDRIQYQCSKWPGGNAWTNTLTLSVDEKKLIMTTDENNVILMDAFTGEILS